LRDCQNCLRFFGLCMIAASAWCCFFLLLIVGCRSLDTRVGLVVLALAAATRDLVLSAGGACGRCMVALRWLFRRLLLILVGAVVTGIRAVDLVCTLGSVSLFSCTLGTGCWFSCSLCTIVVGCSPSDLVAHCGFSGLLIRLLVSTLATLGLTYCSLPLGLLGILRWGA
jgi:hypothetical protein